MYRLFLSWLTSHGQQRRLALFCFFALVVALPLPVSLRMAVPGGLLCAAISFLVLSAAVLWRYWLRLYQFGKATWRFHTLASNRVVLRYAPTLDVAVDLAHILERGVAIAEELHRQFGFPLKRRLVIFLFSSTANVGRLFKAHMSGCAFIGGDAVLAGVNDMNPLRLEEVLRHEVVHLYSGYWSRLGPPLNTEGLATWLMGSVDGRSIDFHALAYILTDRYLFLGWLLESKWFYGSRGSRGSYVVAGSFTGHLIRHFGWERYRDFFRGATTENFEARFAQAFGLSLPTAERQWRDELLARRQEFEPEMATLIGERSVEAAYAGVMFFAVWKNATLCSAVAGSAVKRFGMLPPYMPTWVNLTGPFNCWNRHSKWTTPMSAPAAATLGYIWETSMIFLESATRRCRRTSGP